MKTSLIYKLTTGRAAFLLLLTGAFVITLAMLYAALASSMLPEFIPALAGGAMLAWLRQRFSSTFDFATVFLVLLPLAGITCHVWWWQGRGGMQLSELLPIWGGVLACLFVGIYFVKLKKRLKR